MDISDYVLYESGPVLVVNKPSGISTQSPPGIESLELHVKQWLKERDNKPGNVYLGVPHRLDRASSGAIVFARHVRAARRLSKQFENRDVRKLYWCLVSGNVHPAAGAWSDFMRKVPNEPRAEIVPADAPEAREARLDYRTLGTSQHGSWLEIQLHTGRMHQIRLQAASHGFPVLGDALYGSQTPFGTECDDWRRRAIALHSVRIEFTHPMTGEPVSVDAPAGSAWEALSLRRGEVE